MVLYVKHKNAFSIKYLGILFKDVQSTFILWSVLSEYGVG